MMYRRVNNNTGILGSALAVVLGLGVAGFSDTTQADGWYAGIGAGESKFKEQNATCSSLGNILSSRTNCSFDLKDTGWKVFGGYQFNTYAGVEAGYIDFGKLTAHANGTLGGSPATGDAEFKAKSFEAVLVGTLPVGDALGIIGRFGVFRWDVDAPASAATTTGGTTASVDPSRNGSDITFGAGVKYDLTKKFTVRAEMNRYKNIGDQLSTGESFCIDLYSISLVYNF